MKQLLLAFIIFCAQSVTAQKSASKVYVSSKAPVKINLPRDRELYGQVLNRSAKIRGVSALIIYT